MKGFGSFIILTLFLLFPFLFYKSLKIIFQIKEEDNFFMFLVKKISFFSILAFTIIFTIFNFENRWDINSNFWGNMFLLFIFMISVIIIGVGKYGEE